MILSFLFFGFIAYLAYRLLMDFILPVYRTTRQLKEKFREMNERMHNQQAGGSPQNFKSTQPQKKAGVAGDYIDFEEVKD